MTRKTRTMAALALLALGAGALGVGVLALSPGATGNAAAAGGETRPVLVELFTSQGCSSCPPADEFAVRLSAEEDVLVLSLPVDYWDYLGWKDTLAQPAFTERQHAYAKVRRQHRVYTPQMMIDGQQDAVGSSEHKVRWLVQKRRTALESGAGAELRLEHGEDGALMAHVSSGLAGADSATLWLVRLDARIEVAIGRGENRGRSVTYANVAREMTPLGRWHGGGWSIEVPAEAVRGNTGAALILQADPPGGQRGTGEVLGTAWIKRPAAAI